MNVTNVTLFPIQTQKVTNLKAKGVLTLEDSLDLKYLVVSGSKGPFVTWQGTEKYTKKDGTTGYNSPIFVTNKDLKSTIDAKVLEKYNATGGTPAPQANSAPAADGNFTADDIPF